MKLLEHLLLEISEIKYQHLFNLFKSRLGFEDKEDDYKVEFIFRNNMDVDINTTSIRLKHLFEILVINPDVTKSKYSQWLTNAWTRELTVEDGNIINKDVVKLERLTEAIALHNRLKNSSEFDDTLKDITKLSLGEFTNAIFKWNENTWKTKSTIELVKERLEKDRDYTIEYVDEQWMIFKIESRLGAMILGAHASWCTSAGEGAVNPERRSYTCYYSSYEGNQKKLYVILNKKNKNKLFQLYIYDNTIQEFKDRINNNTGTSDIKTFSYGVLKYILFDILMHHIEDKMHFVYQDELNGYHFTNIKKFQVYTEVLAKYFMEESDTINTRIDKLLYRDFNPSGDYYYIFKNRSTYNSGNSESTNGILIINKIKELNIYGIDDKKILDTKATNAFIKSMIEFIDKDKLDIPTKKLIEDIGDISNMDFPKIMSLIYDKINNYGENYSERLNWRMDVFVEGYIVIKLLLFFYLLVIRYDGTLEDRVSALLNHLIKLNIIESFTIKGGIITIINTNSSLNNKDDDVESLAKEFIMQLPYKYSHIINNDIQQPTTEDAFIKSLDINFDKEFGIYSLLNNISIEDISLDSFVSFIFKDEYDNITSLYNSLLSDINYESL